MCLHVRDSIWYAYSLLQYQVDVFDERIKIRQHIYNVCSVYFCNMFQPHRVIFRVTYFKMHKKIITIAL